jgi:hypothetical protein
VASGLALAARPAGLAEVSRVNGARLSHSGHTADAGANPHELTTRTGHGNPRAALIYLHSSAERQRALANEVGRNARAALSQEEDKRIRKT